MNHPARPLIRVGDIIEFQVGGNPRPPREWEPEVVTQIRICDDFDDKEGQQVSSVAWLDIQEYICLVVVIGTRHWARNHQIRPVGDDGGLKLWTTNL